MFCHRFWVGETGCREKTQKSIFDALKVYIHHPIRYQLAVFLVAMGTAEGLCGGGSRSVYKIHNFLQIISH